MNIQPRQPPRSTFKTFLCALPAIALIMAALITNFTSFARAETASLNDAQKAEVRELIQSYIRENPEIVVESLKLYQEKQQKESMQAAEAKIVEYKDYLNGKTMPSAGNPDGDVTVVEFFDLQLRLLQKSDRRHQGNDPDR